MLTITLVTAAAPARRAMPAGSIPIRHGAPKIRFAGTVVPTVRSCASTFGFASAAVIGDDIPGNPPWSPPV